MADLLLYAAAASIVASAIAQHFFLRRLKSLHHPAWLELGARGVFVGATPSANMRFARYLWLRQYRDLSDAVLHRLAGLMWLFTLVGVACLIAFWLAA